MESILDSIKHLEGNLAPQFVCRVDPLLQTFFHRFLSPQNQFLFDFIQAKVSKIIVIYATEKRYLSDQGRVKGSEAQPRLLSSKNCTLLCKAVELWRARTIYRNILFSVLISNSLELNLNTIISRGWFKYPDEVRIIQKNLKTMNVRCHYPIAKTFEFFGKKCRWHFLLKTL